MARRVYRNAVLVPVLALVILLGGCSDQPYKVAQVDGVVLIQGQPAPKIYIQFIPDVDKGTVGPRSTADTDEQGRFTLNLEEGGAESQKPGAVVGWHRIVVVDLRRGESATGQGVPIRFGADTYGTANSTPLRQEVKDQQDKQTVEIKIP